MDEKNKQNDVVDEHQFNPEDEQPNQINSIDLDFLEDIPQYLEVEVVRQNMRLSQILSWKQEGIVEFSKMVGELLDVMIEGHLVARGEVVAVNNRYGLRITEIARVNEKPGTMKL